MPNPRSLSRRDPESRRVALLSAAYDQFSRHGYEATSVSQVASAAGVSVGTLFKHFGDKARLLAAVLADVEARFVAVVADHDWQGTDGRAELMCVMHQLFQLGAQQGPFFWSMSSGTEGLRAELEATTGHEMQRAIAEFFSEGIARGTFRHTDTQALATLAYGMVASAMRHAFTDSEQSAETWAELAADTVWRAMRP